MKKLENNKETTKKLFAAVGVLLLIVATGFICVNLGRKQATSEMLVKYEAMKTSYKQSISDYERTIDAYESDNEVLGENLTKMLFEDEDTYKLNWKYNGKSYSYSRKDSGWFDDVTKIVTESTQY